MTAERTIFACPNCHKRLSALADKRRAKCPGCKVTIDIPRKRSWGTWRPPTFTWAPIFRWTPMALAGALAASIGGVPAQQPRQNLPGQPLPLPAPMPPPVIGPPPVLPPVLPTPVIGPPAPLPKPPLPTVADVLALVDGDVGITPPEQRPFVRYLWVFDPDPEDWRAVSHAVNAISRASVIYRSIVLGKDRLMVVRLDLRLYAPLESDLVEWLKLWEELRFDPAFSLLVTADTLKLLKNELRVNLISDPAFIDLSRNDVLRQLSPEIDPAKWNKIALALGTQAPVVDARYFLMRALTTIQDAGLFKTLYGGLYYEFAGIKEAKDGGTDEDLFFQDHLGIGNIKAKITAKSIYDKLRSDQRVAMFRSNVTGKPRQVDYFHGLQGRSRQGSVAVTKDVRDQDVDHGAHAILNLLEFRFFAKELIADKNNGLHFYALFNAQGKLQREVPPDVAIDHEIPGNRTKRLQGAISCMRCHEAKAIDEPKGGLAGWQPLRNDVTALLPHVVGDLTDPKRGLSFSDRDRINGLYAGSPRVWLQRARDDYSSAVLEATGSWRASKQAQADAAQLSSGRVTDLYNRYWYDPINAEKALAECGVVVDREAPKRLIELAPVADGFAEDARYLALTKGHEIQRNDWSLIRSHVAGRIAAGQKGKP